MQETTVLTDLKPAMISNPCQVLIKDVKQTFKPQLCNLFNGNFCTHESQKLYNITREVKGKLSKDVLRKTLKVLNSPSPPPATTTLNGSISSPKNSDTTTTAATICNGSLADKDHFISPSKKTQNTSFIRKLRTPSISRYNQPKQLTSGNDTVHNDFGYSLHRKNVKLKEDEDEVYERESESFEYVLQSTQRLSFLYEHRVYIPADETLINTSVTAKLLQMKDKPIGVKLNRNKFTVSCQSKNMRSSPETYANGEYSNNNRTSPRNHSSAYNNGYDKNSDTFCKCKWHECNENFRSVESLTKHVKVNHIQPAMDNDVFVCLWRDCKFSNQPSCSFKWLSKHVTGHCDLKPFKCVISGCDMTFATQSGLARHVPTHFNESRVRRACVLTSEASQKESLILGQSKPKRPVTSRASSIDKSEVSRKEELVGRRSRLKRFVGHNTSKRYLGVSSKALNCIRHKVQKATLNPSTGSGYNGNFFRIDHQVIGRRTQPGGTSQTLLRPSLNYLFENQSFWFDSNEMRKRNSMHLDVPVIALSNEVKNRLYDQEHCSHRRKKRRK